MKKRVKARPVWRIPVDADKFAGAVIELAVRIKKQRRETSPDKESKQ